MSYKKITAVIFSVILLALPIATAFSPKKDYSESENRVLASFPSFSVSKIFDKSFMNEFDAYISDHFIGRDLWVSAKSKIEIATLKKENNGILLTDKNTLVEDLEEPNLRKVSQNKQGIIDFANKHSDKNIFIAIAPTACDIYSDYLPYGKSTWSQQKFIDSFTQSLPKNAKGIDIYSTLLSKKDQYIYYNTDHHWTSLGAYYAYVQIANSLGFIPYDINKNEFDISHASHDFYGTFSSKANISVPPDTIDIYTSKALGENISKVYISDGKNLTEHDSIYFKEWLDKKDKYSVFLGQIQPQVKIKTKVENQKKLLIFKDSFSHSLVPFLSLHYSEIELIDLRYTNKNYSELVNIDDFTDILLLYNTDSVAHLSNIASLGE